jgi:hypothetical protein
MGSASNRRMAATVAEASQRRRRSVCAVAWWALAAMWAFGCAEPRVSPWGAGVPLALYAAPADLQARLAEIDEETRALGLRLVREQRAAIEGGGELVARGYEGRDALGRAITAVRVATADAVVLALGPARGLGSRIDGTELVTALARADGGELAMPSDLSGDGIPDVALRGSDGALRVAIVGRRGARVEATTLYVPLLGVTRTEGGEVALVGRAVLPIALDARESSAGAVLEDVVVWSTNGFTRDAPGAGALRRTRARARDASNTAKDGRSAADEAAQAIERAWDQLLDGAKRDDVIGSLRRALDARVGAERAASLVRAFEHEARVPIGEAARRAPTKSPEATP